MSSSKAISNPTPSGIVTIDNNERVIPATRRADGTVRKERRVRPGFVPQEDVARYKNPWRNNENNLESINNEHERVVEEDSLGQLQSKISEMSVNESNEFPTAPTASITIEQLENTTKKIKVLEKKIRQMERIKEKQAHGEALKLEEEEKLSKLESIQEELRRLKQGDEE
ncbi:hypothetical protein RhiirA5_352377 [Rhizophagus irregularis]|uniref:WIBG Mago-binding domain-containing protein n=1 Tax=Rhizophagus irregularis TaxID=588596 RepID=A0A2N0Q1F5_9GLOM|nr:hypothetical protein RhiirA5_352377 [Rhizophagus irregularis]